VFTWSEQLKEEKLAVVGDKYARNLLSLLLDKDPSRRPDPSHVISHPFLSGQHPERLMGEAPTFDVFLSYRVDSDSNHVEMLYNTLTGLGLKVWWDKLCLLPGQRWEEGFCDGLVNSRCFVCLLSRNAINHPDKPWQNFCKLEAGSRCDNVLLEWRLALELRERGMIEGVFPVFIGNVSESEDASTGAKSFTYSDYFATGCHPSPLPAASVGSVEGKLREHLGRQGLGLPLDASRTVQEVMGDVTANQGGFWRGEKEGALSAICESIVAMRQQIRSKNQRGATPTPAVGAVSTGDIDVSSELLSTPQPTPTVTNPDDQRVSETERELTHANATRVDLLEQARSLSVELIRLKALLHS
jgi:hypothetical protein